MATAPTVPDFSQYNFEIGDTTAAVTKQNGQNSALVNFGNSLTTMTNSINQDLTTMSGYRDDAQTAAQSASADANQTALDRQAVSADAGQVALDKQAAEQSAQSASADATAADASATSAASSATAADASATSASQSETDAEAALADFLRRYLGPSATPPATDNEGNPLQVGALYLSTATGDEGMRYWNGAEWRPSFATIDDLPWEQVTGKPDTATRWPAIGEVTGAGTSASLDVPASGDAAATEVVLGSDTRLSNARTPTAHTHPTSDIVGLQDLIDDSASRVVTQSLVVPPTVRDVEAWSIEASAVSLLVGGSIASFEVTWWDGFSESVPATGGAATLSRAVDQPVGGTVSATVHALDDIGNASASEAVTADVVANGAPVGPISIGAPTQVVKNSTFQVSFTGATDPDGDPVTYTITDASAFVFAKTSGITEGEIVEVTAPDVASDTDVTFSVVAEDSLGAQSAAESETISVLAAQVIGVELIATGGPGGTWGHIDVSGASIATPSASWFNGHPVFGGISDVVVDGQDMVEIPKFYWRRGTSSASNPAWWISDKPIPGFAVMPAFVLDGGEVDAFQVGKYQGSESGGKLQSIASVLPAVNISLNDALSLSTARNAGGVAGFRLWHYDMWLAIQWLYLVEVASMDSQTATGQGRVNESSAASVDATDVSQATYRGIVGLWGNVDQLMDGVRASSGVIERREYNGAWVSTGEGVPGQDAYQYPITFRATGDESWISSTYSTTNDSTATAPDGRHWKSTGEAYARVGGAWASGGVCGLWTITVFLSATDSATSVGARLARII